MSMFESLSTWTTDVGILDDTGKYTHLKNFKYDDYGGFIPKHRKGGQRVKDDDEYYPISRYHGGNDDYKHQVGVHHSCCKVVLDAGVDLQQLVRGFRTLKMDTTSSHKMHPVYKVDGFNLLKLQEQDWNTVEFGAHKLPFYIVADPTGNKKNAERIIKITKYICR